MTKPTVLRRLVNVLAVEVPAGVDRLVGTEPGSLPIAAALSLETGLPLVAQREDDFDMARTDSGAPGRVPDVRDPDARPP